MKTSIYIFTCFVFIGFLSALLYNDKLFILFMIGIIYIYTLVEVSIEKTFEGISNPKIRGTVMAIGWFFCSIMAIASIMLLGFLAKMFSYHVGLIIIMAIMLLFHFAIIVPIHKYKFDL